MRSGVIVVAIVIGLAGVATAGELQLSADAPLSGLPALSKDGAWFARPIRVQPSGCSGAQSYVELGAVGGPGADARGTLYLVKDQCDGAGASQIERNLETLADALRGKGFASVGTLEARKVPTTIDSAEGTVEVNATGKSSATVSVAGSSADRWTVKLDGAVTEVRGWYAGRNPAGAGYVSVLLATAAKDTGARGRERWVDLWPVASRTPRGEGTPVDVATRFMTALKQQDGSGVAALLSAPFWKVGLTPVSGKLAKGCRKQHAAKKDAQLDAVARCMAGAGRLYTRLADTDALAEMDLAELPDELKKHKRKVARLVAGGAKLVRYHVNDGTYYVFVIFVLDPATDHQTASAILESVDIDD